MSNLQLNLSLKEAVALANMLIDRGGSYAYADDVLGRLLVELIRRPEISTVRYEHERTITHLQLHEERNR